MSMGIDTGWERIELDQPEVLRQALVLVQGANADTIARIEPVEPPLVPGRGLRRKPRPASWNVRVVHWSDETGSGVFELVVEMPEGPALAERVDLPMGTTIQSDDGRAATLQLPFTMSPASAATLVAAVLAGGFGGQVTSGWQVCVEDNTFSVD
jgi:hypothetical protein